MKDRDDLSARSHLELEERVRRRAHEIWASRPGGHGEDTALEDWLQAEQEVLGGGAESPAQNRGTVVGDARVPSSRPKTKQAGGA